MNKPSPLQVSLFDVFGGADRVALTLHEQYLEKGLLARLLVSNMRQEHEAVELLNHEEHRTWWARSIRRAQRGGSPSIWRAALAEPLRTMRAWRGLSDYSWPASIVVGKRAESTSDPVVHFHVPTVHFDLRMIPALSQRFPVFFTLHAMDAFTGGCLHAGSCEKWMTTCGNCPRLKDTVGKDLPRDSTKQNLRERAALYRKSRLYLASPSRWMADFVADSILAPAIQDLRVIPNGVDTTIFTPASADAKAATRASMAIPQTDFVISMSAIGKLHPYKDQRSALRIVEQTAERLPHEHFTLLLIGDMPKPDTTQPNVSVIVTGYLEYQEDVARHLQASDVYLHCAFVETFGLAIVEAQLCGLPVIATDVGGISETFSDKSTGVLFPANDHDRAICELESFASDRQRVRVMGEAAVAFAREHFSAQLMASRYLAYYEEALERTHKKDGG